MNRAAAFALPALGLLAGCGSTADPWLAFAGAAVDAQAGVATEIASHFELDASCVASTPVLEIVAPGALGAATVGLGRVTYFAPRDDDGDLVEDDPCDGVEVDAATVFYDAPAGVSGVDTVVYRELRGGVRPDVEHTVTIRVR